MSRSFLATLGIAALAAMTAACGGPTTPAGSGPASGLPQATSNGPMVTGSGACAGEAPAEGVGAALALIDAANLADGSTISPIQGIRFTPAGTLAACRRLTEGVGGDARWAAAWVYATAGTDPAPLLPLLASDDASIRAIGGAGVASMGRADGLDALAALLAVDADLRGSRPPVSVARYAAAVLSSLVESGAGDMATGTAAERAAASAAWTSWLEANRSRLSFDTEQHGWLVK